MSVGLVGVAAEMNCVLHAASIWLKVWGSAKRMLLHDNDNGYVNLDHLMVQMLVFPLLCRIFLHLHENDTVTSEQ